MFAWHEAKNQSNNLKHGIDFKTVRLVFDDPHDMSIIERVGGGGERRHTIGSFENIMVIVVVHTYRKRLRTKSFASSRHAM